jgi:hypothetical protein
MIYAFSERSSYKPKKGKHIAEFENCGHVHRISDVKRWLEYIDLPWGKIDKDGHSVEYGVYSEYHARAVANLRFYQEFCDRLPEYPWRFNIVPKRGLTSQWGFPT